MGGGIHGDDNAAAGLGVPHGLGVVTPYAELGLADERSWRADARWQVGPAASLSLEGMLCDGANDNPPEHGLVCGGSLVALCASLVVQFFILHTCGVSHFISSSFSRLHRSNFPQCLTIVGRGAVLQTSWIISSTSSVTPQFGKSMPR